MVTFYQRRGTGKSSHLVLESHSSGLPIATYSQAHADHLQWLADKVLHTTIPKPFVATPETCQQAKKYLVDEGGMLLQKLLGGEIVLMTMTDEGENEFDDYMDKYILRATNRKEERLSIQK